MSLPSPSPSASRWAVPTVAGLLLTGALALIGAPAASAAGPDPASAPVPAATGLHEGMMPATSPDARVATSGPGPSAASTVPSTVPPTGVDVAHYQHPDGVAIDWPLVAASGQRFAIVKATEVYAGPGGVPVLYTNPWLAADLGGASAAGIVVGTYAFAHPEFPATTQADDFAAAIGTLPEGSLPPVLDLETSGGLSVPELQAWTQAFLDRLEQDTGTVPMIYTGPGFWATFMGDTTAFAGYPLWEAHWTSAAAPARFGGWSTYTVWQFTDAAVVPGIRGYVDQNRLAATP